MATTSAYSPDYGTDPTGSNLDYGTSDPRKIASQSRRVNASQYANDNANAGATQDYLTGTLLPQLQMTPEEQQRIVTGAGISAGTGTQAAVGAAQRAANAAGGNPLALAAYRARAAKTQGANAGDAMTQARIGASDAAAQRTGTIASYYQGLQQQQNQNAQNDMNRQQQSDQLGVSASQTPSTFDKIMGGVTGALGAIPKLDEGGTGSNAVVGEGGPEKIVDLAGGGGGRNYMDDGGFDVTPSGGFDLYPENANAETAAPSNPQPSFWQKLQASMKGNAGGTSSNSPVPGSQQRPWSPVDTYTGFGSAVGKLAGALEDGGTGTDSPVRWPQGTQGRMERMMNGHGPAPAEPEKKRAYRAEPMTHSHDPMENMMPIRQPGTEWMSQAGQPHADGGIGIQGRNGIFTEPTNVKLKRTEAVVPLGYRAKAKVRPSMAALPAARNSGGQGAYL